MSDPTVPAYAPRRKAVKALRVRRRLHTSLVQVAYLVCFLTLAVAVAAVESGPTVSSSRVTQMLFALSGGLVSFVAIVYSLLFVVLQWSTSTYSPRLTLFRDRRLVWHSFGFFVGGLVYCLVSGFLIGDDDEVTALVPAIAVAFVVVAMAVFKNLQAQALRSIQLAPTLDTVVERGRGVLDDLFADHDVPDRAENDWAESSSLGFEGATDLRWHRRSMVLQQVDVAKLVHVASRGGVIVELLTSVGDRVPEGGLVARVHGAGLTPRLEREVLACLLGGVERTFDQDPLLALRLLVDIALRALSPAINDPATAVQAVDAIDDVLRPWCTRDIDVGRMRDEHGDLRVVLIVATWEQIVASACDEIAVAATNSRATLTRLERMLTDLAALAPPTRREPLLARVSWIRAQPAIAPLA